MRLEITTLQVRTTPGTGDSQSVRDFRDKHVQFSGAFTATFRIEVSLDGSAFFRSGSDVTAPGIYSVPEVAGWLRITTVSFDSGSVAASLGAYNAG